jgi:hypothetical protein
MKQARTAKLRRPPLPPILEVDEEGVPVAEMSFHQGRRWSADGDEPAGVALADWPTELDD